MYKFLTKINQHLPVPCHGKKCQPNSSQGFVGEKKIEYSNRGILARPCHAQVVEQEGLRVRERGHDAALSLLARLAGILRGVGAEQLDHHLLEKTRVQFVETEVSSKEAKSTRKNIASLKLMGLLCWNKKG